MEFKHGNDQRHADGIGDVYVHDDDDGRLYGRNKYDYGNDYGEAEQYHCEEFGGGYRCTDLVYQHPTDEHHLHDHGGNGFDSGGITGGCYGFVEFKHGND